MAGQGRFRRWPNQAGRTAGRLDQALRPDIAAFGLVTGKKLADYISPYGKPEEWVSARRIVNGTDRTQPIAGHAERFQAALVLGGW